LPYTTLFRSRPPGESVEHLGHGSAGALDPHACFLRGGIVLSDGSEAGGGAEPLAQRPDQVQLVLAPDEAERDQALQGGADLRGFGGDGRGELGGGGALLEHGERLDEVQLGQGERLERAPGGGGPARTGGERPDPARQRGGEVGAGEEQGCEAVVAE